MATPALKALRGGFPEAQIFIVARPVIADLLRGLEKPEYGRLFDKVITFQKSSFSDRLALAKDLRQAGLDAFVLLTNSLWSAAIARMGRTGACVGYNRDGRGWLLTERVAVPDAPSDSDRIPQIDYYLKLLDAIGCPPIDRRTVLAVAERDATFANSLWHDVGWDVDAPALVINNNAATQPDRMWPADRVLELAKFVAESMDWKVLLHCGPGEREMANAIASRAGDSRIASMGQREMLPIGLSKAVLRKSTMVVSSDSGPRHIAIACDRPVVSLFSATDPAWTKSYNLPEFTIQSPSDSDGQAKMSGIPLDQVIDAVKQVSSALPIAA
ncbi:MAG: glycosyltransferase family 9 protein [Aureliella sp.]